VGEVTAVEQRDIAGTRGEFYILRILDNGMKVMVPVSAATQVGLRSVMNDEDASDILSTMRAKEVAVDVQPWSRRFRVYTEMIKSGSPTEIAKVLRDMNRLKFDKDLSFGERRLLDQARSLLLKELALAKKTTEAEMAEEIRKIFSS
jgi:CarD family transcriptional regulator